MQVRYSCWTTGKKKEKKLCYIEVLDIFRNNGNKYLEVQEIQDCNHYVHVLYTTSQIYINSFVHTSIHPSLTLSIQQSIHPSYHLSSILHHVLCVQYRNVASPHHHSSSSSSHAPSLSLLMIHANDTAMYRREYSKKKKEKKK